MKNAFADRVVPIIHLGRDQQARVRAVAERVFPTGTRLITLPGEAEFVLLASWKLGTDPMRPNKRSKTVRIGISPEALEEYGRNALGERIRPTKDSNRSCARTSPDWILRTTHPWAPSPR
jgi:hypothetical protein